jgi:hypothetical protein
LYYRSIDRGYGLVYLSFLRGDTKLLDLEPEANPTSAPRSELQTIAPQQIVEALQEQMAFEAEEMGESEVEEGIIELLWDYDVMTAHVASSTQIDSSALIEAMNFRTDVLVLTALVDEEWRSPTQGSREEWLPLTFQVELLLVFLTTTLLDARILPNKPSIDDMNAKPIKAVSSRTSILLDAGLDKSASFPKKLPYNIPALAANEDEKAHKRGTDGRAIRIAVTTSGNPTKKSSRTKSRFRPCPQLRIVSPIIKDRPRRIAQTLQNFITDTPSNKP